VAPRAQSSSHLLHPTFSDGASGPLRVVVLDHEPDATSDVYLGGTRIVLILLISLPSGSPLEQAPQIANNNTRLTLMIGTLCKRIVGILLVMLP